MRLVALLLVLTVPLVAAAEPHIIKIVGGGSASVTFPSPVVIHAGESIVFLSEDMLGEPHRFSGQNIDTPVLWPGDHSPAIDFPLPGTYYYSCPFHSTMRFGHIRVI